MERQKPPVSGRPQAGTITAYALQQKKNAAEARRKLWSLLRRKVINGEPFTRNAPIGSYLVDFYCPAAKLVIELDDRQPDGGALDTKVTWLTAAGYTVLRLGAEDVRRDLFPTVHRLSRQFRMRERPKPTTDGYSGPSML
jgi:very-short-patch-repair endonuclease